MKKSVLLLAAAFGVTGAFAQDLTSKKGEAYLPEAGDWSIGIDANPFLQYAGNMFSGATGTNGAPSFNFLNGDNMIVGKMFKDEKTAYRLGLRIGYNSEKQSNQVSKYVTSAPTAPTAGLAEDPNEKVTDKMSMTDRFIGLSGGIEMRRGKTRLQGFYGGELAIWGMSTKEKYKYGNEKMDQSTPTSTNPTFDASTSAYTSQWDLNGDAVADNVTSSLTGYTNVDEARLLKRKTGGQIGLGVRGFIGVEYFVLPKISLAGEFGWGVGYAVNTKNKATWDAEGVDLTSGNQNNSELEIKDAVNNGSFLGLDTDNKNSLLGPSGVIRVNFHF